MARPTTFLNLSDLSKGLARALAEGIETQAFPADQAMLSIVSF
ncbi:MAG: hypothetical protein AAF667_01305 [Pseudomonadota bacterium]